MNINNEWDRIFKKREFLFPFAYPLAKFPFYVDVEPTNNCNYNCLMCNRQIMTRKKGYMDFDLYKKIVDQISLYECGLRFCRQGEPILHPRIFEMVEYADKKGVLTFISSNGSLLNRNRIEALLESNLDVMRFSFQGVAEEGYELMRNSRGTNKYKLVVRNIEKLVNQRTQKGLSRPFIILNTTVTNENAEQIEKFKKNWTKIVDKVEVGKTTFSRIEGKCYEKLKYLIPTESFERVYTPCVEIMIKLSINWNGDITPCCSDYDGFFVVGNITNMPLSEAWTAKKVNKLRETVSFNLRHKELDLCSRCYKVETKFDESKRNGSSCFAHCQDSKKA